MKRWALCRRAAIIAVGNGLALLSAACGGGDGSSVTPTPTPSPSATPSNHAPTFTSADTVSVTENTTKTIYVAAASDLDGDAVTISISGGADASRFALASGALSFTQTPNYDHPTDANSDNVYEVTLTATDSKGASTSLPLRVAVTNDREGISVSRVAGGFGANAVLAADPRRSGLIVVSQDGSVHEIDPATGKATESGTVLKPGETARIIAASYNGFFSVVLLDLPGQGVIARAVALPNYSSAGFTDTPVAAATNLTPIGTLFGNGFYTYGALGDPSGKLAQDAGSGYGKLFQVNIDPYCGASVPSFCLSTTIIGDGLHAPVDGGAYEGQSFLLDRGTDQQDEVDFFDQNARPLDFGWPDREGTFVRTSNPPAAVNGPSLTYPHGSGFFEGTGLTGGTLYTGNIASLVGRIIMTDNSGKIFDFPSTYLSDGILHPNTEMENRIADFEGSRVSIGTPVAIKCDFGGRVFILNQQGDLYATN